MSAHSIRSTRGGEPPTQLGIRDRRAGSALLSDAQWADTARSLRLSGRELEIVRGVFDNRTEHALASELHISPHTVHTHLDRLHRKLGVGSRVQVVLCVVAQYLDLALSPARILPPGCARHAAGRCPLRRRLAAGLAA